MNATCSICLESLTGSTAIGCGHEFHEACIAKWVQRRRQNDCCPVCRAQIHDPRLTALREINVPGVPARFEEAVSDDESMEDSDDDAGGTRRRNLLMAKSRTKKSPTETMIRPN